MATMLLKAHSTALEGARESGSMKILSLANIARPVSNEQSVAIRTTNGMISLIESSASKKRRRGGDRK